jgi:hypothetical protein
MGGKYRFDVASTGTNPGAVDITVWNFPMIKSSQSISYDDMPHLHVTGTTPTIVVTGMLTGCTVTIVKASESELRLSHIQPGGCRPGSFDTEQLIKANGRINGTTPTHYYGPEKYDPRVNRAHVIGVAVSAKWQIWGQTVNASGLITSLSRLL